VCWCYERLRVKSPLSPSHQTYFRVNSRQVFPRSDFRATSGHFAPIPGHFAPISGHLAPISGRLAPISGRLAPIDCSTFYLRNKCTKVSRVYFLTASEDDHCLPWSYCMLMLLMFYCFIVLWTLFPVVYNTYWYNAHPCFHNNIP